MLSPRLIVKSAKAKGLNVIAVTDHGTLKGAKKVVKIASSMKDLLVIPGIELKTNYCDVVGLFLFDEIKSNNFYDVIDDIRNQNGIIVLPHPSKYNPDLLEKIVTHVDLVEGLNGRMNSIQNSDAQNLGKKHSKPLLASSDAHFFFEIGCVRTIFSESTDDLDSLKKLILNGKRRLLGTPSPYFVHALSFGVEFLGHIFSLGTK